MTINEIPEIGQWIPLGIDRLGKALMVEFDDGHPCKALFEFLGGGREVVQIQEVRHE